jgi:tetratricopeptide (TPR) repeat protein/tRNA A-37 threonylcarbamoyl transferase component Bud32
MPATDRCPRCESALPPGAPGGLCPRCLLRAGLDLGPPPDGPGPGSRTFAGGTVFRDLRGPALSSLGLGPTIILGSDNTDPAPVVLPGSSEAPPSATGRYQVLGEIARGGMGAVLKGRDPELGRDLALKVLLSEHRSRPAMVRRFVEEAQIGGQLQHPGVVPVYDVGVFPDRRPFFAMKLVRGRTLAALLDERKGPADGLPRFLAIFEPLCQTVAYAHAHRVIHRDLKPSNVMVGSFGEVQVMDWGLAKVLDAGGVAAEPDPGDEIRTGRSGSGEDASRAGSVLRTPSYMAPEQARGEVDRLDERCDVFALGAILCEILTGRPPIAAASREETIARAAAGDTAEAEGRLGACEADSELLDLARRCLAADPAGRPRHAGEVAAAMTVHLAGVQERLRSAELVRVGAQARAEEVQKRRRIERRLSAAVLAVLAVGATGVATQWRRAERNLDAAIQANAELTKANAREVRAREQADARFRLALETVGEYTTGVSEDLHLREPGPEPLRRRLLASALAFAQKLQGVLEADPQEAPRPEMAEAYERVADITGKTGDQAASLTALERALAIRERLAQATGAGPEALAAAASDRHLLGLSMLEVNRPADGLRLLERAGADFEGLSRAHPETIGYRYDRAEVDNSLGNILERIGRGPEAIDAYERSVAAFDRLIAAASPEPRKVEGLGRALVNLSIHYTSANQPARALDFARRSVEVFERINRGRPGDNRGQSFLAQSLIYYGGALDEVGRGADAVAALRRAEGVYEALLREFPNNLNFRVHSAEAHHNLALHFARHERRWEAALEEYRKSLTVYEALSRDNPRVYRYAFLEASARMSVGAALRDLGRPADALLEVRKAVSGFERLVRDQPALVVAQWHLARAHELAGLLSVAVNDLVGAAAAYRRAAELYEGLPTRSPDDAYNLACVYARLARPGMPAEPGRDSAAQVDRALVALRRAVAAGFRDAAQIRTDSDLEPLRARPEFRLLLLDAAFPADPFAP